MPAKARVKHFFLGSEFLGLFPPGAVSAAAAWLCQPLFFVALASNRRFFGILSLNLRLCMLFFRRSGLAVSAAFFCGVGLQSAVFRYFKLEFKALHALFPPQRPGCSAFGLALLFSVFTGGAKILKPRRPVQLSGSAFSGYRFSGHRFSGQSWGQRMRKLYQMRRESQSSRFFPLKAFRGTSPGLISGADLRGWENGLFQRSPAFSLSAFFRVE